MKKKKNEEKTYIEIFHVKKSHWVECSPMAPESGVQSQVELYQRLKKCFLISPYLTLSIIRYGSSVKWSNPGKGVALPYTLV